MNSCPYLFHFSFDYKFFTFLLKRGQKLPISHASDKFVEIPAYSTPGGYFLCKSSKNRMAGFKIISKIRGDVKNGKIPSVWGTQD